MQFQVKGQDYFLAFAEEERRWFLFAQVGQGIQRIPVYVDAPKQERNGVALKSSTNLSS